MSGAIAMTRRERTAALLGVYRPALPVFVEGRGSTLIDEAGDRYLDFTSGIAVNALGYGDPGIEAAIIEAARHGVLHTSNLFRTAPAERLAEALVAASCADRVFFCNSGAEANEAALKFARRHAGESGGPEKREVIALRGSFHGRLFGTLAVTDRPAYRAPFEPVMPGAHFVDPSALDALRSVASPERTAAIIAEPVQGEGGIVPLPAAVLATLREVADACGAALIFDEIQCGLGRTGRLFAYEVTGIEPDIITLAKPLAGGLPMGAVLLKEPVAASIRPGDHATTFGGGPLVASVALEVLNRVSDARLLDDVAALGARLSEEVTSWSNPRIAVVRGIGLMWGIELREPAAPFVARALGEGLLVLTAGERVLRLLPPLNIAEADLDRGLTILKEVLA